VNYFYETDKPFVISVYEKRGREYREIGVLFEGNLMFVEAFEMFSQFCNAVPMWQAVQHSLEAEKIDPSLPTSAYEVRLINSQSRRVIATVLWESSSVDECKNDFKKRKTKTYNLWAEIDLTEDEDIEEINLSALFASGGFRVLDITPFDEVKYIDTEREEK
jgi:hypothetical protein